MAKQIIQFIVLFVILLLVQVLVCNNISLFHVATPFIFVYVLFRLPIKVRRRDENSHPDPSIRRLGTAVFMKNLVSMTFCYCALIVTIELFSTANILHAMLRVICSTALSFVLMLGIDSIVNTKNDKGL